MKSFTDDDVDEQPREQKTSCKFPLDSSKSEFDSSILFQHSVPGQEKCIKL